MEYTYQYTIYTRGIAPIHGEIVSENKIYARIQLCKEHPDAWKIKIWS